MSPLWPHIYMVCSIYICWHYLSTWLPSPEFFRTFYVNVLVEHTFNIFYLGLSSQLHIANLLIAFRAILQMCFFNDYIIHSTQISSNPHRAVIVSLL